MLRIRNFLLGLTLFCFSLGYTKVLTERPPAVPQETILGIISCISDQTCRTPTFLNETNRGEIILAVVALNEGLSIYYFVTSNMRFGTIVISTDGTTQTLLEDLDTDGIVDRVTQTFENKKRFVYGREIPVLHAQAQKLYMNVMHFAESAIIPSKALNDALQQGKLNV